MSEVKRYDVLGDYDGGYIDEAKDGRVVLYTDYAALEADYLRIISAQDAKWRAQYDRDSAELFRLCAEREEYKRQAAALRQHKTEYMDVAEVTRKTLEAECERLRELLREALPALQHISDTAQNLEDFTLAERVRSALSANP